MAQTTCIWSFGSLNDAPKPEVAYYSNMLRNFHRELTNCIYCDDANVKLTDEHIIPHALNGELVLKAASCENCNKITSRFERSVLRGAFESFRIHSNSASRRPKNRPQSITVQTQQARKISNPDDWDSIQLGRKFFPMGGGYLLPDFGRPGILQNRPPWESMNWTLIGNILQPDVARLGSLGDRHAIKHTCDGDAFARMIAKIAHSFCVAVIGLEKFRPFLSQKIVTRDQGIFHFLGTEISANRDYIFHSIGVDSVVLPNGRTAANVRMRFFELYGTPTYSVIAGEISSDALDGVAKNEFHLKAKTHTLDPHPTPR